MIYYCEVCRFTFKRAGAVDSCPDFGKPAMREANETGLDEYRRTYMIAPTQRLMDNKMDCEYPFSKEELEEALRAIISTISKCEKAQMKLREGTPQFSLTHNRIKALRIASSLITKELNRDG